MLDFDTILTRLPSLKNLLNTHGSMSLFEYAKKYYHIIPNESPLLEQRKQEFLNFLDIYVTKKFGKKSADIVTVALSRNYAVSTAEHHGPMGHPFFFQSALLRAIIEPELPVINFATSHVSLGNSSYPRGLVFHTDVIQSKIEEETKAKAKEGIIGSVNQLNQQNGSYLHLPFFGSKSRMCPVFQFPAYTRKDIKNHCIKRLQQYHQESCISEEMYQKILHFVELHVLDDYLLTCSTYSEQITRLNHIWWGEIFPDMPPYISLDAEDMAVELLQEHLLNHTIMARMITDNTLQPQIEQYYNGISCCFNLANHAGTYLFWYLDEQYTRHALWREGDELVTQDKSFRMKMNHKEYQHHLERNHLIPSGLLVYTMFACYYGLTCFGGFAQGEYLPRIQEAFIKIAGESENISTQSSILNEDMVFLFQKNGEISVALDLYVGGDKKSYRIASENFQIQDSIHKMEYEIGRCF